MEESITLSFHVCNLPGNEEYYLGAQANYDAYEVLVPKSLIPEELWKIIEERNTRKPITGIAIVR